MTTPQKFYNAQGQEVNPLTGKPIGDTEPDIPMFQHPSGGVAGLNRTHDGSFISTVGSPNANPHGVLESWGKAPSTRDLTLESGAVVKIRDMELMDLINLGVMDSLDAFGGTLLREDEDVSAKNVEKNVAEDILKDVKNLNRVLETVDKVVARCVVEPSLILWDGESEIDPDKRYVHLVPFEDRMEIFTEALPDMNDTFPAGEGSPEGVGALEAQQDVSGQSL